MHKGSRIGPQLSDASQNCDVTYGFSNKAPYESFRSRSDLSLSPYPLVKGSLRNQIEGSDKALQLVAIDAGDPLDPTLAATTMATVLEAQEGRVDHVVAVYLITLDEETKSYRLADHSEAL